MLHLRRIYFGQFNGEQDDILLVCYFSTNARGFDEDGIQLLFFCAFGEAVVINLDEITVAANVLEEL